MGESEAHKRWQQENTRKITLRFNITSDADILAELDRMGTGGKAEYVRAAIREMMAKKKQKTK